MRFVTEPGTFWFGVGASLANIRISQTIELGGEVATDREKEIIATTAEVECANPESMIRSGATLGRTEEGRQ